MSSSAFRRLSIVIVILAAASHVARATDLHDSDFPVVIENATIVVGDGSIIENGSVMIENGRISAVGNALATPPHAKTIDCDGMTVYYGFISAHAHVGISDEDRSEEERQRLEDENPDARQRAIAETRAANRRGIHPQYLAADHVNISGDALSKFHKSGFTTALVSPRDGILGGQPALINLSDSPVRRALVRSQFGLLASFRTGEPGDYPQSILGVFAMFRQTMHDAKWHAKQVAYFSRNPNKSNRPAADPALTALQPVISRDVPLIFKANSEHEINRALDLAAEFNLNVIISGAKEAYKVVDRIKSENIPLIVSLKFSEEPEFGKEKKRRQKRKEVIDTDRKEPEESGDVAGSLQTKPDASNDESDEASDEKTTENEKITEYEPLKLRKERRRLWEESVTNIVRLHEADVPFSLSTHEFDSPSELIKNLRLVIERGLPVESAVAALTTTPASLFQLDNQMGTIASGAVANLVVMSAPLDDKDTKTRFVFTDGRQFEYNHDHKPKKKDESPSDESADDDQVEDDDTEETGPTWACEIKSDRIPATVTNGNVLIQNATVITMAGPTMQDADVLIRDGKIAEIGQDLLAPNGVPTIDAAGLYVTPGLIDAHSHMSVDGVNEGTLAITAEVRVGDTVRNDSVGLYRALAGGVTTAHTMHGSANPVGGQNVIFKFKYLRPVSEMIIHDAPRTIKWALGENVKQSNWASAHGKRFPNGRMGVESVIRDALVAGQQYADEWSHYESERAAGRDVPQPRRDLRREAMAEVLSGDIWIHTHCYRSDEIIRLMQIAEDFDIRIAVLQHILEGYRIMPEIHRHGASASTFANDWAYKIEAFGAVPHNAAMMTRYGINASVNSDSANTIRYMNIEAAKSMKWGNLSEFDSLALVTINPAAQLGLQDRIGSLEVGKDGDIAIFNGHPLNTHSRNVMTLIEGDVYFQHEDMSPRTDARSIDWNKWSDQKLPESPNNTYAITNATVHTVSDGRLENTTIIIRDGTIAAIGNMISPPAGSTVLDAQGLHVYPGLIDAMSPLGLTEIGSLRATRDNFDIATYAPELRTVFAIHPHSEHIAITRAAGTTACLAKPSGGRISGQSALVNLEGWTTEQMLIQDNVALHMSIPSLPARLSNENKKKREKDHKETMRDIESFLNRAKQYAAADAAGMIDIPGGLPRDRRLEAMIPFLRGERPVAFSADGYKEILDTIDFAEKHNLKPIITGGRESWKLAETLAQKDIPVIFASTLSYPRGQFETWDSIYKCPSVLDNAGVEWCFATNSATNGYDLGIIAGMAVAHGLDPDRAIRALTLSPAEILGVDQNLGSIEVGKQADLIVTTLPPTQTASKVTHAFIRGKPISLDNMHERSVRKFRARPNPELPPRKELAGPPIMNR